MPLARHGEVTVSSEERMQVVWLAMAVLMAAGSAGVSEQNILGGGRLSAGILVRCAPDDSLCAVLNEKTRWLQARNPEAEARAAVAAGDFRLAAAQTVGDPLHGGGWDLPGVQCRNAVRRENIGKWHVFDDYVTEAEARHTEASIKFIEAYNRALVSNPAWPDKDVCAAKGRQLARAYAGSVTSFAEAARSRRLVALQALETGGRTDFGTRDKFDRTALAWAVYNGDVDIALWLLERTQDVGVGEYRTPLAAHALNQDQVELATALVQAGGHPTLDSPLCERNPMAGPPTGNEGCTWAGLLIRKGAWDLVADLKSQRADLGYEAEQAINAALARGDLTTVQRLFSPPDAGVDQRRLGALVRAGAWDILALSPNMIGAESGARSDAELSLWRAAAGAGRWEALTFLMDYGADMNLLPAEQLSDCRAKAEAGDVTFLLACARDAQTVRERFAAAVAARDAAGAIAVIEAAADPVERNKVGLSAIAYQAGDAALMTALVADGLPIRLDDNPTYAGPSDWSVRGGGFYKGVLKAEAEAFEAAGYRQAVREAGWSSAVLSALEGDDDAMLTALLSEPVPNLGRSAELWLDRGAQVQGLYFDEQDTSVLPRRPEGRIADRLAILAPAVIRSEGPMGLEGMMHNVLCNDWDDLIADWVELGFDFRKVKEPRPMWRSWVDFSAQCRPTTVRYLAEGGLTRDFVEFRNERPWPLLVSVAAVCRDPANVPAVAALNLEDVNALASHAARPHLMKP